MAFSNCDDNRLKSSEEANLKLDEARKFASKGEYRKALEAYLYAFDYGR